jgi:hypothetical protein
VHNNFPVNPTKVQQFHATRYKQTKYKTFRKCHIVHSQIAILEIGAGRWPIQARCWLEWGSSLAVHNNFTVNPTKVPHFPATHYKQIKYKLSKSVTLPIPNLLS